MTSEPLYLDISRLISRARRSTPSGIDRVEMAYAEELRRQVPGRLRFAGLDALGRIRIFPTALAEAFLRALAAAWRGGSPAGSASILCAAQGLRLAGAFWQPPLRRRGGAYILVSHHHLDRPGTIRRFKEASGARFVPLVQDLIPVEFPEYGRPGDAAKHRRRMATVADLADALIVGSAATEASFRHHYGRAADRLRVLAAPLGVDDVPLPRHHAGQTSGDGRPYFVHLSTIEPRKNHLLLLHVWRAMARELGPATPRLVLIGRRGWENENILDILDRCDVIQGSIDERNNISDAEVRQLLAGARALLMPSFAEGYGLPLAEALSLGVPAICSDIPSLREIGGDVAEYLDPIDGPAWRSAVLDYANPLSARRAVQQSRLQGWKPATWRAHIEAVVGMIDDIPERLDVRRPANQTLERAEPSFVLS